MSDVTNSNSEESKSTLHPPAKSPSRLWLAACEYHTNGWEQDRGDETDLWTLPWVQDNDQEEDTEVEQEN